MNFRAKYTTFNDSKIDYRSIDNIDISDITNIGMLYIKATNELPTKVFLGLMAYSNFIDGLSGLSQRAYIKNSDEKLFITLDTGVGVLQIIPIISTDHKFILVGQQKDYNRYCLDEDFEKEVLSK